MLSDLQEGPAEFGRDHGGSGGAVLAAAGDDGLMASGKPLIITFGG